MTDAKTFETWDHANKVRELWAAMSDNDKAGVRFGLFPFATMQAAEKEGFNGHKLCIALMDVASKNGGMRA